MLGIDIMTTSLWLLVVGYLRCPLSSIDGDTRVPHWSQPLLQVRHFFLMDRPWTPIKGLEPVQSYSYWPCMKALRKWEPATWVKILVLLYQRKMFSWITDGGTPTTTHYLLTETAEPITELQTRPIL
jgi:hypothetical protein